MVLYEHRQPARVYAHTDDFNAQLLQARHSFLGCLKVVRFAVREDLSAKDREEEGASNSFMQVHQMYSKSVTGLKTMRLK